LIVLNVVPLALILYGPPPEEYLDHLLEELHQIQVPEAKISVEHWLAEGNPAAAILKAASDSHCDLIVMGTHGRKGLGRLLLGSVAEQVVRLAPCPVLTVRTPFFQAGSSEEKVGKKGATPLETTKT
jgi:universal stress protein A